MATYSRLSVETGGIVDRGKQSAKDPGATLIIGLGGTGSDLAIKVKKEVFKQLKPDDLSSPVPEHKNIKFLVVDSDPAKVNAQSGLVSDIEKSEFFDVSNSTIKSVFGATNMIESRPELFWLNYKDISIADASNGAGGVRQVGRFLLVDKAEQLYLKIKSSMQAALVGTNGKLHVHICAGISGGTGSGTFLDVCYLVREALREIGKPEASVCGYFFLPDVNLSVPSVSADPNISSYIKSNGYSALQELDYCMNFANNKDSFRMNYGFKRVDDPQQPVDLCYLISATDASGKQLVGSYDYAMGVVSDFIISYLAKVQLPPGEDESSSALTLDGHVSNLQSGKAGIKLHNGANVNYNILGASVAEMPLSEVATYLGSKLFEKYADLYDKTPTEQDVDDFIRSSQLGYDAIKKMLSKNTVPQVGFPDGLDGKAYKQNGNHGFVKRADDFLAKNKGCLETNLKAITEGIAKDFAIPEETSSLINRTFKGLNESYVSKLDYGPFFAQRLLSGGNNKNLLHKIDGMIAQNKEQLDAELRQEQLRIDEYESAKARMDSSSILNEGSRIREYKNALNNLYIHHWRVEFLQGVGTALQKYKQQVIELNNSFFSVLVNVMETLRNTFEHNSNIISEGIKTPSRYSWKIVDVPDIQENLDEEVAKLDIGQTLDRLMNNMMANVKSWITNDEDKITKMISDFVLAEFAAATQKTITDYLYQKFQIPDSNATVLADKIKTEILENKLASLSVPLFWQTGLYKNEPIRKCTLTVPFDAAEIVTAAESYAASDASFDIRKSGITDKISMMRFYSGLPLYAYQALQEYEHTYLSDARGGKHLYERGEENWNVKLPSPMPASFDNNHIPEIYKKRNDSLIAEFEQAKELGIVVEDQPNKYVILKTEALDVAKFIEDNGGYMTNGKVDAVKGQKMREALEAKKQSMIDSAEKVQIPANNAMLGCEYMVMLDFYVQSPVLNDILRAEVEKMQVIANTIAEIAKEVIIEDEEKVLKKDFFRAIFTGVITYGRAQILYNYTKAGLPKELVLQNSEMPLGDSGAYCAFQTFREIDKELRAQIVSEYKKKDMLDNCPEIDQNVADLMEKMPIRINDKYLVVYDKTTLEHDAIERFYEDFMKELELYRRDRI